MKARESKPKAKNWRITFEVPKEWQANVKANLAMEGMTLTEYLRAKIEHKTGKP